MDTVVAWFSQEAKAFISSGIPKYRLSPEWRHELALFFQAAGVRPHNSTNIADEDTRGYGNLDDYGFWEYQL